MVVHRVASEAPRRPGTPSRLRPGTPSLLGTSSSNSNLTLTRIQTGPAQLPNMHELKSSMGSLPRGSSLQLHPFDADYGASTRHFHANGAFYYRTGYDDLRCPRLRPNQPFGHVPPLVYWANDPCVPYPGRRRSCQGVFALTPRGIKLGPRQTRSKVEPHVRPMAQARFEHAQMLRGRAASEASLELPPRPRPSSAADVERRHAGSGGRITLAAPKAEGGSLEDIPEGGGVRRTRPRSAAPSTDSQMDRTRNEQPFGRRWCRKSAGRF